MPLIVPFSSATIGLIENSNVKIHILFFLDEDTMLSEYLLKGMAKISKKYIGKLVIIIFIFFYNVYISLHRFL